MKKISGFWILVSIVAIVTLPIVYSRVYKSFYYITVRNAFVSAKVVSIAPSYVSGRIKDLYVTKGSDVKKGQIVALIDDTLYKAEVERKESRLKDVLTRLRDVDNNTAMYEELKADAEMVSKDVELAKLMLSYTRVASPVNGVVAKDAVDVGDFVSSGDTIVYVYKPSTLYVKAYVEPSILKYFRIGRKVQIYQPSTGKKLKGSIYAVGGLGVFLLCNDNHLIPVYIKIPNNSGLHFAEPVFVIIKRK